MGPTRIGSDLDDSTLRGKRGFDTGVDRVARCRRVMPRDKPRSSSDGRSMTSTDTAKITIYGCSTSLVRDQPARPEPDASTVE